MHGSSFVKFVFVQIDRRQNSRICKKLFTIDNSDIHMAISKSNRKRCEYFAAFSIPHPFSYKK